MEIINAIFGFWQDIINCLNRFTFADVPIGLIIMAFMITSMVISVFWKGAQG